MTVGDMIIVNGEYVRILEIHEELMLVMDKDGQVKFVTGEDEIECIE